MDGNADIGAEARATPLVEYAEVIRIALNNLESAVATVQLMGYRVSARISHGRILSVGVVPNEENRS